MYIGAIVCSAVRVKISKDLMRTGGDENVAKWSKRPFERPEISGVDGSGTSTWWQYMAFQWNTVERESC